MTTPSPSPRLDSVDVLRGLVIVLMAWDHTRDFFHSAVYQFDALDLAKTTPAVWFSRWITHFCAPVFVLLAGTGAFLSTGRGRTTRDLSWFLLTRGLWLVVLELTWVRWAGWTFGLNLREHQGLVLWAIGWSMVTLAGLVWLPRPLITGFGLLLIAGHHALDGLRPEDWGRWAGWWRVIHAGGTFEIAPGIVFGAGYPLVPWIGVMAAGYGLGAELGRAPEERRRRLALLGGALITGFLVLRGLNGYGEPRPWTAQDHWLKTAGSFLDCTKYPPSLDYLLMTLGPALLFLAWLDRGVPRWLQPALLFGRVPLFFYLLHLPLIHALSLLVNLLRFGHADWLWGNTPAKPPPGAGFGLPVVLGAWLLLLLLLHPACRWFADYKRRTRAGWTGYL